MDFERWSEGKDDKDSRDNSESDDKDDDKGSHNKEDEGINWITRWD